MKKTIFIMAILWTAAGLVCAGPAEFSGKEMKQVAPPPAPECSSWTGFYIGGFGGYKYSNTDIKLDLRGDWEANTFFQNQKTVIESTSPHNLDTSGFELGGLIGYNYQWKKWVLGLEADGGYLWLRDSGDTGIFPVPGQQFFSVATSLKTHYLVTIGPRIGYAFCKWLPYVTGGLAVGDIDFHQQITQRDFFYEQGGGVSETRAGWMVGGGLEYAITDHWRARAQYQYIDLGCVDFNSVGVGDPSTNAQSFTGKHEACLREHNASFALIYGF